MTAQPADALVGTRERALAVALDLFSREGYDAVSMRQIAEELGVSKAALYHHFPSKLAIAEVALSEAAASFGPTSPSSTSFTMKCA